MIGSSVRVDEESRDGEVEAIGPDRLVDLMKSEEPLVFIFSLAHRELHVGDVVALGAAVLLLPDRSREVDRFRAPWVYEVVPSSVERHSVMMAEEDAVRANEIYVFGDGKFSWPLVVRDELDDDSALSH